MKRNKNHLFIALNLFIFITTAIAVPVTLTVGSRATRLDGGDLPYWQHIATFTILSNIFLGLIALAATIVGITKKDKPFSSSFITWYLAAASAGLVTFFTVVLFLAPMRAANGKDYFDMLLESMFFLHFLNPLLVAFTFIFLTGRSKITLKSRLLATLPIILYAIPYILNVVVLQTWPDFYGLTFGGKYFLLPLVFVIFIIFIFSLASLLTFLRKKFSLLPLPSVLC